MIEKIITHYWTLIVAFFTASVAIGAGYERIDTMEEAYKVQAEHARVINEMKAKQERIDERTTLILEMVKDIKASASEHSH
jgi:hypothetical protein